MTVLRHKPISKSYSAEQINHFQYFVILIKFVIVLAEALTWFFPEHLECGENASISGCSSA